jgi:hypothetical protein
MAAQASARPSKSPGRRAAVFGMGPLAQQAGCRWYDACAVAFGMAKAVRMVVAASLPSAVVACAGAVPGPSLAPQPAAAFALVPYPPPAAHVELIPPRPVARAVWVDGQWAWDGQQWAWLPGGWSVPPKGARFSPWAVRLLPDGRFQFAPSSWRDSLGREVPPPPVLAAALGENGIPALPSRSP